MKFLFIGSHHQPGGPNEVNRNIIKHLPTKQFSYIKEKGGITLRLEKIVKILFSRVVVISGICVKPYEIKLASFLKKKIIYIMHGCLLLERGYSSVEEQLLLEKSSKVLCVSAPYSELIKTKYPQFASKIGILTNGVNWDEVYWLRNIIKNIQRDPNRIILFGGGRKVKGNLQVCKAIEELNNTHNQQLHVDVYGYFRSDDDSKEISEIPCVNFHHVIPHNEINLELVKSQLFIQNSKYESFSLALIDSLGAGCSVLFSVNVGAKDIISNKKESDVIHDSSDINELKEKILNVMKNPNNERLYGSIDRDTTSYKTSVKRLISICEEVIKK